jgi:hypothetical protein
MGPSSRGLGILFHAKPRRPRSVLKGSCRCRQNPRNELELSGGGVVPPVTEIGLDKHSFVMQLVLQEGYI